MASVDDIIDLFDYCRSAGLKKVPRPGDVAAERAYSDVLQNIATEVLEAATRSWMSDPDKGAWFPAAPELLGLCLTVEAQLRSERREQSRGCHHCGEVLEDDGTVREHGTGFRTLIQHRFPTVDGRVLFDAAPIKIGSVRVLCDCDKGRKIHAQQKLYAQEQPEKGQKTSRPAGWRPTLDLRGAWEHYGRPADVRVFLTGTRARWNERDADPRSPFFSRPSPEELEGPTPSAHNARRIVDGVLSGTIDPADHVRRRLAHRRGA
jgi:hypothetical protein